MIALLAASLLWEIPAPEQAPVDYDGAFTEAPVLDWQRRLPGTPLMAFTHSERSRPLLAGESVYLGSASGLSLLQLNRGTGELEHSYPAQASVQSQATVVDDRVYFADTGGYTHCFELGSDEPVWSHYGGAPVLSTAVAHNGLLYVANVDDTLYALDLKSGELEWRYQRPADIGRTSELTLLGSPAPVVAGRLLLAGFADGALVALDLDDGELNWERRVGEGIYPDLIATPSVVEGDVYVGGYSQPLVSFDLGTRSVRWRLDVGTAAPPTPDGDALFHGATDGKLRKLDRATGDVLWTWDSETTGALTQPQLTPAGVLVTSTDGSIYLVDSDDGALLWEWDPGFLVSGFAVAPALHGRQLLGVTNAGQVVSMVSPLVSNASRPWNLGIEPAPR